MRIVSYDQENGQMVLHNYMDFDDLKDYVDIFYEMTQDGLTVEKENWQMLLHHPIAMRKWS